MKPRAGFTLLEIAVALSVLGVGIVSCLNIFNASLRLLDRASKESAAVREARGAMDALMFGPVHKDEGPGFIDRFVGHVQERVTKEGLRTRMTAWVEPTEDRELTTEPQHKLYHVFVSVTWPDGRGAKSYWLDSLR